MHAEYVKKNVKQTSTMGKFYGRVISNIYLSLLGTKLLIRSLCEISAILVLMPLLVLTPTLSTYGVSMLAFSLPCAYHKNADLQTEGKPNQQVKDVNSGEEKSHIHEDKEAPAKPFLVEMLSFFIVLAAAGVSLRGHIRIIWTFTVSMPPHCCLAD